MNVAELSIFSRASYSLCEAFHFFYLLLFHLSDVEDEPLSLFYGSFLSIDMNHGLLFMNK